MKQTIIVAGATGNLGTRIVRALVKKGSDVEVKVLVRPNSNAARINELQAMGAKISVVNMASADEIKNACLGADCVVSALSGLEPVIIDAQKILFDGVVAAGVPRFIPSDYSLDFTKFNDGENRNLDLRRRFHTYIDKSKVQITSIFNGAFADMLTGQMPVVMYKQKRILYWGNINHRMCFTTMDNTAEYTANAALDTKAPRYLRIAGDLKSPAEMQTLMTDLTGKPYGFIHPGGPALLSFIIKVARFIAPAKNELYPAWQGMQYMRNMIDERATLTTTDNDRYPDMHWTTARDVIAPFLATAGL